MYKVAELKYSQNSYKKILNNLRDSLIKFFVGTIHEELKEADFWFEWIERIIKSKTDDYLCFEIRSDKEVIGFMITSLINKKFFLIRHFFIMDIDDKEEGAYILLKEAIKSLKDEFNINTFRNAAFTFPEDYLANPFKRLGFKILKRHNMTLRLNTFNNNYELSSEYSIAPFNKEELSKIAELSVQIFKNHPDASFWEEINSVSKYSKYLENSMTTYFLQECSFVIKDKSEHIVGFCLAEKGDQEDEFIIQNIAINELNRGKGIGKALLSRALKDGREQGYKRAILTVTEGNPAQKLYENIGFRRYTSFNVIIDDIN